VSSVVNSIGENGRDNHCGARIVPSIAVIAVPSVTLGSNDSPMPNRLRCCQPTVANSRLRLE